MLPIYSTTIRVFDPITTSPRDKLMPIICTASTIVFPHLARDPPTTDNPPLRQRADLDQPDPQSRFSELSITLIQAAGAGSQYSGSQCWEHAARQHTWPGNPARHIRGPDWRYFPDEIRLVGEIKPSHNFRSEWRYSKVDTSEHDHYRLIVAQVYYYMKCASCRFGYILTDKELVGIMRKSGRNGDFEVSDP